MKLISAAASPFVRKVHVLLHETGQIDDVGPRAAKHLRPGQIIPGCEHLVLGRRMIETRQRGGQNYPVRHWLLFP